MSDHRAIVEWRSASSAPDFVKGKYSREHTWSFDGGLTLPASPSPSVVPAPWSNRDFIDPEEAFVASISSCHMLTFLYLAAKAGHVVERYRDEAIGLLTKNEHGVPWISKVTLAPVVTFAETSRPSPAQLAALHHGAHEQCFISQSVKSEIVVATS